jgi:nucleoside-diphosphate-sugar epimerase
MSLRVLVTGHNGYIGSVLAPFLKRRGYDVHGVDCFYFGRDCSFCPDETTIPSLRKDIRDLTAKDLAGYDAVIHLAALCNDPLGNMRPEWTFAINYEASVRLAELAKAGGAQRFLMASSCSMHGKSADARVTEDTPVNPLTPYGLSKIQAETAIAKLADDRFSPTFLRNGTVYGVSPRLRIDIVLNNLAAWAFTTGRVRILSAGTQWRPVIHVEDVSAAFLAALSAHRDIVHNQVFHVGSNQANHTIRDMAEIVKSCAPGCSIECLSDQSADQRTYIADFGKIERMLPEFRPRWDAKSGTRQLLDAYQRYGLKEEDLSGARYVRLNRINQVLRAGELDETLRWRDRAHRYDQ